MGKVLQMIEHVKSSLESFDTGDFPLNVALRMGRPNEIESNQINTKKIWHYTIGKIDSILKNI